MLETRTTSIKKLANLELSTAMHLRSGSWDMYFLRNPLTSKHVQIVEAINSNGKKTGIGMHMHPKSDEFFLQLAGTTDFGNGIVLKAGEMYCVPAGTLHDPILSEDGECIILIHPLDNEYPLGS